jgi:hypothetical protein
VERVHEIDLDHLTQTSRGRLHAIVRGEEAGADEVAARDTQLRPAVELIRARLVSWPGSPSAAEQLELHRAISTLYGHPRTTFRDLLPRELPAPSDLAARLRPAAEHVARLLPARLRASRRWITAGAIAGTLGGLAAVTFVAPAAIGTLPVWSALGGVVGGLLRPAGREGEPPPGGALDPDRADAVRAALLHAMLLDLQGRSEIVITRVIDAVAGEDEAPAPDDAALGDWLRECAHRYDLALQREDGS